jgi:hypothetical protein
MKKQELIEQLNTAKTLTSTVDIDKMIELIKQLEQPTTITPELGSEIVSRIERCLDYNNENLVDKQNAEFQFGYNGREVELVSVDIELDTIMEHITSIIDEYVVLEDEEEEKPTEE